MCALSSLGRRLNGFLGLTLHDRTILFLVILLDKSDDTVFALVRSPLAKEGGISRQRGAFER